MREALVRELCEEVGVTPSGTSFLVSLRDPNAPLHDPATYHIYIVTDWRDGEPRLVGDEHTELTWFPFETAANLHDLALAEYRSLFRTLQKVPRSGGSTQ